MSKAPKIHPGERCAEAIQRARMRAQEAGDLGDLLRIKLDLLAEELMLIDRFQNADDLKRLVRRIDRLQELRRMMELNSFHIEAGHALSEAWRRLP